MEKARPAIHTGLNASPSISGAAFQHVRCRPAVRSSRLFHAHRAARETALVVASALKTNARAKRPSHLARLTSSLTLPLHVLRIRQPLLPASAP